MAHEWQIRELTNRETIRQYLNTDRLYSAYALGDLEPSLFPHCRWWLAERAPRGKNQEWALVLHFRGLTPHVAVCLGEPAGVGVLLAQTPLPDKIHLVCRPDHMRPASKTLALPAPRQMVRMVTTAEQLRPVPADNAIRLTTSHLDALQTLYAMDPNAADAFAPYQLANGIFYGIEVHDQLVSVAGTHLVAPTERIGAVGNIFTHPSHRGRGLATACTSAVCAELLAQKLTVVLNVSTKNTLALRLYRRLGFIEYCTYYETIGKKNNKEKLYD